MRNRENPVVASAENAGAVSHYALADGDVIAWEDDWKLEDGWMT